MDGPVEKQAGEWRVPEGRWSAADGEAMAAAYEASGQTMRAFAGKHGMGAHRVSYWCLKVARKTGEGPRGFAPVRIAGKPVSASSDRSVEVQLRNGRSITIRGSWDEAAVRTWVSALEATP